MQYFLKIKTVKKNTMSKVSESEIKAGFDPRLVHLSLTALTLILVLCNPVFKILIFCSL